jgi:hypothetical protein
LPFLAKFKSFGLERIEYDLATSFESNGRNIFIGRVSALYLRKDGTRLRWHADIITVVTVEEGKATTTRITSAPNRRSNGV